MNMIGRTAAAVALFSFASGVAVAVPAVVERDSNVRQGPGTNYSVQGVLQRGTVVEVDECRNGWCAVYSQRPGFIAESLLSFGDGATARYEVAPMSRSRVIVAPSYGYYDAPSYGYYDDFPPGYYSEGYYPRYRYGSSVGFGFGF